MNRSTTLSLIIIFCLLFSAGIASAEDIKEKDLDNQTVTKASKTSGVKAEVDTVETKTREMLSSSDHSRKGLIRAGLVGPGFYAGNKGIGAMMNIGLEGEYFLYDRLSAGLRISIATDFSSDNDPNAILSFLPMVRYIFDLSGHPRWSFYVQAGVGLALIEAKHAAADIAIPGGGFWWRWTDKLSVGADTSLHILARSNTAISFEISPTLRYNF
jgi:hypothetical protein